jgi:hypothetical protein
VNWTQQPTWARPYHRIPGTRWRASLPAKAISRRRREDPSRPPGTLARAGMWHHRRTSSGLPNGAAFAKIRSMQTYKVGLNHSLESHG